MHQDVEGWKRIASEGYERPTERITGSFWMREGVMIEPNLVTAGFAEVFGEVSWILLPSRVFRMVPEFQHISCQFAGRNQSTQIHQVNSLEQVIFIKV